LSASGTSVALQPAGGSMFYIVAAATIGVGFIYWKKRRERKGAR
jgi:hypothetical protein